MFSGRVEKTPQGQMVATVSVKVPNGEIFDDEPVAQVLVGPPQVASCTVQVVSVGPAIQRLSFPSLEFTYDPVAKAYTGDDLRAVQMLDETVRVWMNHRNR